MANCRVVKNLKVDGKSVMDLINVVPNPYYAYSTYEGVENGGQLDSRVRITNLPWIKR